MKFWRKGPLVGNSHVLIADLALMINPFRIQIGCQNCDILCPSLCINGTHIIYQNPCEYPVRDPSGHE